MTRALNHADISTASPVETLPLLLAAAADLHGARPAMRHKRAGIWQAWSFADYFARTIACTRFLEDAGLTAGNVLVTVGENRPELYAAHLAAQALGAAAVPVGPEFLKRYGPPQVRGALVLCENDAAARAWRAGGGEGAPLLLDEVLPEPAPRTDAEADMQARAWFARRTAQLAGDDAALILHTDGACGPPHPVALSHRRLLETGRAAVARFALGPSDSVMAFLPMSGIGDAGVSLVQSLLAGFCVHCVEGPATFPADLRDVAPTYLPAPARVFELLDRTICERLGAGGRASRALKAAAERGLPGSGLAFSKPLLNSLGLRRCRVAVATGAPTEPDMMRRLRAYGLPLEPEAPKLGGASLLDPVADAEGAETALLAHCLRAQALLRGCAEIERALVLPAPNGLRARLALDDAALTRFLAARGIIVSDGSAPATLPAVEDLMRQRVEAVNLKLAGETPLRLVAFDILPQGFAACELTLEGEVRRAPAQGGARPARAVADAAPSQVPSQVPPHVPRTRAGGEVLMRIAGVHVAFGGVKALTDVSIDVRAGEILSIIGPNGAGKTSLLNVINGVYHPRAGTITFKGKTRARMRPAFAARSGIGRTFQHVSLFKGMSALDNVMVGRAARFGTSLLAKALRLPQAVAQETAQRAAVEQVLAFLDLEHLRKAPVGTLPYGVQKRVELARALATEPGLLLLDEPMAGMTHEEKREMCGFIRAVNASFGTTILLIEHDIGVVMGLSDRVVVLNYGRKIADGTPEEVRADPQVIAAYLGSAAVGAEAA